MYRILNTKVLFLVVILMVTISGCSLKKDHSLTPEEYRKLGIPGPQKIWTNQDFLRAQEALSGLRARNFLSLPRKGSQKSGTVYDRMLNKENLSYVNDTSILISDRAFQIMYFSIFFADLDRMYTDNLKTEQFYKDELIDICIFRLFVQGKMLELAGKIMNSTDPSSVGMRSGGQAVASGYSKLIFKALEEQVKFKTYRTRDLERLSMEVSQSLNENLKWIDFAEKQKIVAEIRNVIEKSPPKSIKNNYRKILEVFQGENN